MKQPKSSRTVRKYYEEITGRQIPKGFEVHHIDFDRSNNDINNLVALPKGLHRDYHKWLTRAQELIDGLHVKLPQELLNRPYNLQAIDELYKFMREYDACCAYIALRDYFLGKIPEQIMPFTDY